MKKFKFESIKEYEDIKKLGGCYMETFDCFLEPINKANDWQGLAKFTIAKKIYNCKWIKKTTYKNNQNGTSTIYFYQTNGNITRFTYIN